MNDAKRSYLYLTNREVGAGFEDLPAARLGDPLHRPTIGVHWDPISSTESCYAIDMVGVFVRYKDRRQRLGINSNLTKPFLGLFS